MMHRRRRSYRGLHGLERGKGGKERIITTLMTAKYELGQFVLGITMWPLLCVLENPQLRGVEVAPRLPPPPGVFFSCALPVI